MEKNRILYAINHRQTEEAITQRISEKYMVVGAVTYKEAILEQLKTAAANTLLVRESLPGTMAFEVLMKRVRVEYPDTRIVVICNARPKQDPFLQTLVSLGIYDIVNSDKPTLTDICSYIITPRTYRDAAQYGIGLPEVPDGGYGIKTVRTPEPVQPEKPKEKKGGFLSDVMKGFGALKKQPKAQESAPPAQETRPPISASDPLPGVNVDLLRASIKESEARKAQSELDSIIKKAVSEQTVFLERENEELKKKLESAEINVSVTENQSASVMEELNTLRSERDKLSITLTDTRRSMQEVIDMYEAQLKALHDPTNTPEWYSEQSQLWATEKQQLKSELNDKTHEAEEKGLKIEALTGQLQESREKVETLNEQLQRARDSQLSNYGSEELISDLRTEASEAKSEVFQLKAELKKIQDEYKIAQEGGPDYSYPRIFVPMLPDDTIYSATNNTPQTFMMIGSKHGVGNTTIALNLAASIAGRGDKTLLVEVNGSFPMLSAYFEMTHIPVGFDEVLTAIASGDLNKIDKAIIRPHGMRPAQPNLNKTYRKLPPGLHFVLFSNESLINHHYQENQFLTEATLFTFLNYVTKRLQYSHVILDIQSDDYRFLKGVLNSGAPVDKLCMTITQDPHSLMTAGTLITELAREKASSMIADGEFLINRFNPNAATNQAKIEKMLHLSSAQISRISEDSTGYLAAASSALPYLQTKGRFWMEYDTLRNKICPSH